MKTHILNTGLDLAMEWGEHWLHPIQTRLASLFPELNGEELDYCNEICQAAMHMGCDLAGEPPLYLPTSEVIPEKRTMTRVWKNYCQQMKAQHPWISEANLEKMYSQGRYHALK
ncbi:MAG: hypothetical protein AAF558_09025 [Verrucomicrobiota bacterium]